MQPPNDKRFEAQLDYALKQLPPLTAPTTLLPRVFAEIERRATLCWYRRPWYSWSPALRYASLALLIASFAGLCFGGWEILSSPGAVTLGERFTAFFGLLSTLATTLLTLLRAVLALVLRLHPLALGALVLVTGAMAASCLGLGTLYYRVATARR
jgi:hypothetical protein